MGRRVGSVERLYTFLQQRAHNFHENIDKRSNILLICLTTAGRFMGAFTSAGFSLSPSPLASTRAFLFGMADEEISVSRLKRNRESVTYDLDFLIFGNDELSIEKGSNLLTSYSLAASENQLHYQRPLKEDYFREALGEGGKTRLKNY